MKPKTGVMGRVFIFITLFSVVSSSLRAAETLQFFTSFSTPDTQLAKEILREALRRNNYQTTFILEPYRRSLARANGEGDGEVLRVDDIKTIDPGITKNLVKIPEPILSAPIFVINTHPHPAPTRYEDLRDHSNGILKGLRVLEERVPNILSHSDYSTLFKLLAVKRIDNVVTSDYFIEELTQHRDFQPQFTVHTLATIELYTYLHYKHATLVSLLGSTLKEMKQDGTYSILESRTREKYYSH